MGDGFMANLHFEKISIMKDMYLGLIVYILHETRGSIRFPRFVVHLNRIDPVPVPTDSVCFVYV